MALNSGMVHKVTLFFSEVRAKGEKFEEMQNPCLFKLAKTNARHATMHHNQPMG
jgi:hypothetical protein